MRTTTHRISIWLLLLAAALTATLVAHSALAGPADRLSRALMRSENYKVRLKAAKGLSRFNNTTSIEALKVALSDPHPLVRAAAARSVGRLKARPALRKLCKLQRDRDAFVRRTADAALAALGGPGGCAALKVVVSVQVVGDDTAMVANITGKLRALLGADARVLLGTGASLGDHEAAVKAGRMPGVALKVRLTTQVIRGPKIRLKCAMAQSIFDAKVNALRGSATQRAEIELGATANEQAVQANMQACAEALVPVVYEGLADYLNRLQ